MRSFDNIQFVQSNSSNIRMEFQQFQFEDFNSYGLRRNSLFDDFSMNNSIEELTQKENSEFDINKIYFIEKPKANNKGNNNQENNENNQELSLERPHNDYYIKDKEVIMANNNSKNHQELIKEEEIESKNGSTKITNEANELLKNEKKIPENEPKHLLKNKRKRGRKTKKCGKNRINDMFSKDNLSRKFKWHFSDYSVSFSNFLKKPFVFGKEIKKLSKEFKTTINKKEDKSLKEATLGDIINKDISSKYTNYDKDHNHKIYEEEIKTNEILREIFSIKYKSLFNIYYKSKRIINLKKCGLNEEILNKYDLNKDIKLSEEVKMFNDLLENNTACKDFLKENNYALANKYKNSLRNCVIKKYMINSIFLIHEECK